MSRYWSLAVATLIRHVPGEQSKLQNLVKLNINKHPYGPLRKVLAAIRCGPWYSLKPYSDPASNRLRQAIVADFSVKADKVFVGNGLDEVLAHVFQALLKHEKPLKFPDVTYSFFYPFHCRLYSVSYQTAPLIEDFQISVDDYLLSGGKSNSGIIFPNPNAPTGRAL